MIDFTPNSIEVNGKYRDRVEFLVKGSQGNGTYERNTEKRISVTKEQAREIRDDLDEVFTDD